MVITRREFLKMVAISSITSPTIISCGAPELSQNELSKQQLNNPPYKPAQYTLQNSSTTNGKITLDGQHYPCEDESGNPVLNIDAIKYKQNTGGMILAEDSNKKYQPTIIRTSSKKTPFQSLLKFINRNSDDVKKVGNVSMNFLGKDYLEFDTSKISTTPGVIYRGDHSFNSIQNLNSLAMKTSLTLTTITPNPVTPWTFAATSSIGGVLEVADHIIDAINSFKPLTGLEINKDKKFSLYEVNDVPIFIISQILNSRETYSAEELFPFQPGNNWDYGNGTMEICEEHIDGQNVISVKHNESGNKEFFGFKGNNLYQVGVYNANQKKEILFTPYVKMGDGNMHKGKSFLSNSDVSINGEFAGTINSELKCKGIEDKILAGTCYGNCLLIEESSDVSINGRENSSTKYEHFYVKDIGKILTIGEGETTSLENYDTSSKAKRKLNPYISGLSKIILS